MPSDKLNSFSRINRANLIVQPTSPLPTTIERSIPHFTLKSYWASNFELRSHDAEVLYLKPDGASGCCTNRLSIILLTTSTSIGHCHHKDWQTHHTDCRRSFGSRRYLTHLYNQLAASDSIIGHTATVFGATGFLGRYIVNRLGK